MPAAGTPSNHRRRSQIRAFARRAMPAAGAPSNHRSRSQIRSFATISCIFASVLPDAQVHAYHVPIPRRQLTRRQLTTLLSATSRKVEVENAADAADTRPHEQRTEGPRKARRLNHPFQHLYRHDDPVHYPTYENSTLLDGLTAREFLAKIGGYSDDEIATMSQTFPPLLDLDVMRQNTETRKVPGRSEKIREVWNRINVRAACLEYADRSAQWRPVANAFWAMHAQRDREVASHPSRAEISMASTVHAATWS